MAEVPKICLYCPKRDDRGVCVVKAQFVAWGKPVCEWRSRFHNYPKARKPRTTNYQLPTTN